jgi:hypothetical protein
VHPIIHQGIRLSHIVVCFGKQTPQLKQNQEKDHNVEDEA